MGRTKTENKIDKAIVNEIRRYLFENSMTIKDFAAKVGVPRSTIHRILNGYYRAYGPTIAKLEDTLGLEVSIKFGKPLDNEFKIPKNKEEVINLIKGRAN